jgi:neutral amino acid transport system ATP-binding protein
MPAETTTDRHARAYEAKAVRALADVPATPGVDKPDPILNATSVERSFGGLIAVDVAQLQVQRGAITALIGPNGAGKTTLFNLLTGFDQPDSGKWQFNDQELSGVRPYKVARMGMVRTFQLTKALSKMSVMQNMLLGAPNQRGENFWSGLIKASWRSQEASNTQRATALLEEFTLGKMADEFGGSLSGGQRKLLEMARALMVSPELIMLDEPMAGVNPALKQSLLNHIRDLREKGMTVLFVEHDMDMVRDISDWVVVMGQGKIIAEGPPEEVMQQQAVIDAYLGGHHDTDLDQDTGRGQNRSRGAKSGTVPEAAAKPEVAAGSATDQGTVRAKQADAPQGSHADMDQGVAGGSELDQDNNDPGQSS